MRGSQTLRRRLVRGLEARDAIASARVRQAFLAVPRELFVPEVVERSGLETVYRDEAIPTKFARSGAPISSSSQPAIMAAMLERLRLEPGLRVLEIGAGTGYNAALLAELVGKAGRVDTVDIDADTAARARLALRDGGYRVRVSVGDGRDGLPAHAPFDRIVVTASSDAVPRAWFDQLVEGGIVQVPLRLRESAGAHVIASLEKRGSRLRSVEVVAGGFMPLRGADEEAVPPMLRSLNASDMTGEQRAPLRQLSGASLTTLSSAAKRRLLAAALEEPRRRALGIRADRESLLLYLSLGLPERRAVAVLPEWGVGVIERDGSGLAYVCAPDGRLRGSISSLRAHGSAAAEHELLDAIRTWVERGRPGPDQLVVGAHVDGPSMRLSWRWA